MHEMNEVEKKALNKMNEALNRWANSVLEIEGVDPLAAYRRYNEKLAREIGTGTGEYLAYANGDIVQFERKPGRNTYRFYQGQKGIRYCWTPWADTKGWYWAFNIVKGSIRAAVKFRKRKTATARALSRWEKAGT